MTVEVGVRREGVEGRRVDGRGVGAWERVMEKEVGWRGLVVWDMRAGGEVSRFSVSLG